MSVQRHRSSIVAALGLSIPLIGCLACSSPLLALWSMDQEARQYLPSHPGAYNELSFQCKLHWGALYLLVASEPLAIAVEVGSALLPSGRVIHIQTHDINAPDVPSHITIADRPVQLWFSRSQHEIAATLARFGPDLERGVTNQNPPCPLATEEDE